MAVTLPNLLGAVFAIVGLIVGIVVGISLGFGMFGAIVGGQTGLIAGAVTGKLLGRLGVFLPGCKRPGPKGHRPEGSALEIANTGDRVKPKNRK